MIQCEFEDAKRTTELRHIVVTGVGVKEGRVLMILRADHLVQGNKYGLPGGFLDRDETLAQGAKREFLEETGYACKPETILTINDDPARAREDRQNVDVVFLVDVLKKVKEPDNEVKEVKWFPLDSLPDRKNIAFDHYEIIQLYILWQKEKQPLPILQSTT